MQSGRHKEEKERGERGGNNNSNSSSSNNNQQLDSNSRIEFTKISDLRPCMNKINCIFVVLEKLVLVTQTKADASIHHCFVADQSGSIHLCAWDLQGESLQQGDIIRLLGGYCSIFKNSLVLYSGKYGQIEKIGEFMMSFSEVPNMSLMGWVPDPASPKNFLPVPPPQSQSQQVVNK